jgi:hypothetical protein
MTSERIHVYYHKVTLYEYINASHLEWEIEWKWYAEFSGKDGLDVESDQHVNSSIDDEHNEDRTQSQIIV